MTKTTTLADALGDYLTGDGEFPVADPIHARLWPDSDRALCTGAIVPTTQLPVSADESNVTCPNCFSVRASVRGA